MFNVTEELIKTRRSVRTFDGNKVSSGDIKRLKEYMETIKNPYNIPVRFRFLDSAKHDLKSPVLNGEHIYIGAAVKKVAHAEEAYGYAVESLVLFAHSIGVETVWIGGTMNRSAFEEAMELEEDAMMPCVFPIGYPAKKMSARETLMRKGVKADKRKDFGEIFFENDFNTPLAEVKAGKISKLLEGVRWAPSAVNIQPWRIVLRDNAIHFYEKKSKGYIHDATGDLQKIDVGIAMCHFEMLAATEGISLRFEISQPDIETDAEYIASYYME